MASYPEQVCGSRACRHLFPVPLLLHGLPSAVSGFHSASPQVLLLRTVQQRFAPSTLERYFAEWPLWLKHCLSIHASPSQPTPGLLPDWLHSRASPHILSMRPIRALTWFFKHGGLPHLLAALQSPIARSFLTPTNPSERRESISRL